MSSPKSAIRIDIQLLRAVAVLSVVVFHFWPSALVSGFAGVDVFFVISGFLITSIIVREIQSTGKLSLVNFWMRRIRRIFPASFAVIVATVAGVLAFGSPEMASNLSRHVTASAFSLENVLLAMDRADYFRSADGLSPLQHFWSLAVEEQFYLVWPIAALAVAVIAGSAARTRRLLLWVIVSVVVLSGVLAVVMTIRDFPGAYFNSFARAWELGLGALVAVATAWNKSPRFTVPTWLTVTLWLALIGTFAIPNLEAGVPSWGVAPAVVLTTILIATGSDTFTSIRNPTVRKLVDAGGWIGDRSFSLYLWHWPIIIIAPTALGRDLSPVEIVVALVATVVVSDLSYRFIETPFRSSERWPKRRPVIAFATVAALSAGIAVVTPAIAYRPPASVDTVAIHNAIGDVFAEPRSVIKGLDVTGIDPYCIGAGSWVFDCENVNEPSVGVTSQTFDDPCDRLASCIIGDEDGTVNVLYVGDSHGRNLRPAIDLVGKALGWRVESYTRQSCPIVNGADKPCDKRNAAILAMIAGENDLDLILTAQSAEAMQPRSRVDGSGDPERDWEVVFTQILASGIPFATFRDNPNMSKETLRCSRLAFRSPNDCEYPLEMGYRHTDFAAEVSKKLGIHVVDLSSVFCNSGRCSLAMGGVNVYMDDDHLAYAFSETLAPLIAADIVGAGLVSRTP
jgi:peptidoglycan/LPS O-acetylase OafA/YrhL